MQVWIKARRSIPVKLHDCHWWELLSNPDEHPIIHITWVCGFLLSPAAHVAILVASVCQLDADC
jgi:hypothetical protein